MRRESDEPEGQAAEDQQHLHELARARQARVAKAIAVLALLTILIVFIVGNTRRVPIDFVFVTRNSRLIWIMFGCALVGGVVGYLVGRPGKQVRLHRKAEQPKK